MIETIFAQIEAAIKAAFPSLTDVRGIARLNELGMVVLENTSWAGIDDRQINTAYIRFSGVKDFELSASPKRVTSKPMQRATSQLRLVVIHEGNNSEEFSWGLQVALESIYSCNTMRNIQVVGVDNDSNRILKAETGGNAESWNMNIRLTAVDFKLTWDYVGDCTLAQLCNPVSPTPSEDCPTMCELISAVDWLEIKECMDEVQIEDAISDLCSPVEDCVIIGNATAQEIVDCLGEGVLPELQELICDPCPPCDDATVGLNGVVFDTIPSGGALDIPVLNSANTPVGSINGTDFDIADSAITLKDTANNTLSTTNVPATVAQNITAPDASVTVNGNAYDTVLSGGSLDVLVEYQNGTPVGTIVGNVVEIPDPYNPVLTIFQRPIPIGTSLAATVGTSAYRIAQGYYAPVDYTVGSILRQQQLAFSNIPTWSTNGYWLGYNNTHGHRYRFTLADGSYARKLNDWFDINNVAIATPGDVIIYDHLTGLQWRNADTFTAQNWLNSLPNPATSYLGETGWWMPAPEEAMTIFDINDDSNYLALVMARGSRTWLSDQNQTSTANAYTLTSNGVTTLVKSTTTGTNGIICKHF